jgi:hypothetical protein
MVTFVAKSCGKVVTAFCAERIDEGARDQDGRFERSAVGFDTAGKIDRIADDRQLQVVVTADIALHHIAIMDAHGHADRGAAGALASLVPSVD